MIDRLRPNNLEKLWTPPPAPAGGPAAPAAAAKPVPQDQASLSARARELSLARQAARQAPEVRAERVAALRQRIAAGAYHVPDSLLAQKLVDFRA
jgi:negative regulator of flagellin synthesis FlgM